MSRIDELIEKLCPDGVTHRNLGEIASYSDTRIDSNKLDETSFVGVDNLVSDRGGRVDASYLPNTARLAEYQTGDILIGNIRPYLKKIWLSTSSGGCSGDVLAIRLKPECQVEMLSNFLYHLLSSDRFFAYDMQHAKGAKMPRGSKPAILKYRIPVPPVEIQQEIVRILDQFTRLEAELEAELEARRTQYDYYANQLLQPADDWIWRTIGSVAEVFDGPHATPKKVASGPWYLSISSLVDGRVDLEKSAHISEQNLGDWTKRVAPRRGDTLFSYETRIGQAGLWDSDEPAALGRRMGILRPRSGAIDAKFLTLAYLGPQIRQVIGSHTVSGSTVDRIPVAKMASWPIAVPSMPRQQEIVNIIEKLDELANGFSIGLPAELNARRKQYEYYRDRLLTFEEATA